MNALYRYRYRQCKYETEMMGAMPALIEIGCGGTERRAVSASSLGQREPCVMGDEPRTGTGDGELSVAYCRLGTLGLCIAIATRSNRPGFARRQRSTSVTKGGDSQACGERSGNGAWKVLVWDRQGYLSAHCVCCVQHSQGGRDESRARMGSNALI
jgi:hypothetical protein